jgi:hypothetical protein
MKQGAPSVATCQGGLGPAPDENGSSKPERCSGRESADEPELVLQLYGAQTPWGPAPTEMAPIRRWVRALNRTSRPLA